MWWTRISTQISLFEVKTLMTDELKRKLHTFKLTFGNGETNQVKAFSLTDFAMYMDGTFPGRKFVKLEWVK